MRFDDGGTSLVIRSERSKVKELLGSAVRIVQVGNEFVIDCERR